MKVADILEDAYEALGNSSKPYIYRRLRDAVFLIAIEGNWEPLEGYVDICTFSDGRYISLPREIYTILGVNHSGRPLVPRHRFFEFHQNGGGFSTNISWAFDDRGMHPTVMDIVKSSYLVAVADLQTDKDVNLRVFGLDDTGHIIRTQEKDGTWRDGIVIPVKVLSDFPSQVVGVDATRVLSRYFSVDPVTSLNCTIAAHNFVTGQYVVLSLVTPPLSEGLTAGLGYYLSKVDADTVRLHATRDGALTNTSTIDVSSFDATTVLGLTDTRTIKAQTKMTATAAHLMDDGDAIEFTATSMPAPLEAGKAYFARVIDSSNFQVHATYDDATSGADPIDCTTPGSSITLKAKKPIYPRTKLTFGTNHNFLTGDGVLMANTTGALPDPLLSGVTYYVRVLSATEITLHNTYSDAQNNENIITLITAGTGTTSVVKKMQCTATTGSSAQITCVGHNLAIGDFVQFETTGTFPSVDIPPGGSTTTIQQNTVYQLKAPTASDTFTIETTTPQDIDFLDAGTGQLYAVISRALTVAFLDDWSTDAAQLVDAAPVKFSTTGSLPGTSPAINTSTTYYVKKISDTVVEIYDDVALTSQVTLSSLGAGVTSLVKERSVSVAVYSDLLILSDAQYFQDGSVVRFTTNGTLPNPLTAGSDYLGYIENGFLRVKDTLGVNVNLGNIGSGAHNVVIARNFTLQQPTQFRVNNNNFTNGDAVTVESDDVLPSPLLVNSTYYVRRISDNFIELYDTEAHAEDTAHTTGRVLPANIGEGIHTLYQLVANIKVSRVDRIDKGLSDGYIKLYAWDEGRTENLTVLGDFHPREVNPSYRRIKLSQSCGWVRVWFSRRTFEIESDEDYLPVNDPLVLRQALNAVRLMDKSFNKDAKDHLDNMTTMLGKSKVKFEGPIKKFIQVQSRGYTNSQDVMY